MGLEAETKEPRSAYVWKKREPKIKVRESFRKYKG